MAPVSDASALVEPPDPVHGLGPTQALLNPGGSNRRKARAHHEINVAPQGLAPLAELGRQSLLVVLVLGRLQMLEPLVHQIQGVVDQLGGLFGGHRPSSEVVEL